MPVALKIVFGSLQIYEAIELYKGMFMVSKNIVKYLFWRRANRKKQ